MEDDRTSGAEPAAGPPFAEVYHRHFGDVYDYAIRLTRDREIAALVVQASFLRVLQEESYIAADAPNAKKLQLFSAAHHDAVERVRQQRGVAAGSDEDFASAGPAQADDAAAASADDGPMLARFAWQAAAGLRLNDYEILDLSVRRGLDVDEIAAVLRIRPQAVGNKLVDVHDAFEGTYSALVVYERGRRACVDLDFLVGGDEWSPALQRRIRQHLKTCHTCGETRSAYGSGGEVLAALTPVDAPAGWEQTILERLQKADAGRSAGPVAGAAADGGRTPVSERRPAQRGRGPRGESGPQGGGGPQRGPDSFPARYGGYGGGGGLGDWVRNLFGDGGPRGPLIGAALGSLITAMLLLGGLCAGGAFDDGGGAGDGATTPSPTITGTPDGSATATQTATATPTATPTGEIDEPTAPPAPSGTATPRPTNTATVPFPTPVPTPTLAPTAPAPTATPDSQGGGTPLA